MRAIPEAEYNHYMRSAAWAATKRLFFTWCKRQSRFHCWFCGNLDERTFQVHHVRYDNFGNERNEDLTLICDRCHTKLHNNLRAVMTFKPSVVVKPSEWLAICRGLGSELAAIFGELCRNVVNPPVKRKRRKIGHV